MSFSDKLKQNKFLITSEIGPPKGTEIEEELRQAVAIKDRVDAINVTDLQSSVMKLGSLSVCRLLKEKGVEPILQMTCRDRNRLALQSDLLSAYVLGIENVLLLTGDHPALGDHPEAKPVFDLDSVQLISVAKMLESGKDMKGNLLNGAPKFCIGAVVNPGAEPLEPEIIKMRKKIQAGAQFFQTQAIFDIDVYKNFLDKIKGIKIPILAGIVILKSAAMAKYMNENVSGVYVPDNLIEEIQSVAKEDRPKKGVEIAVRLVKELKSLCSGIHIMPLGWNKLVPLILDGAGL